MICPCCKRPGWVKVEDRPIEIRKGSTTAAQDKKRAMDSMIWMLEQAGVSRHQLADAFNTSYGMITSRLRAHYELIDSRDRFTGTDMSPAIQRLIRAGCLPPDRLLLSESIKDIKWADEHDDLT